MAAAMLLRSSSPKKSEERPPKKADFTPSRPIAMAVFIHRAAGLGLPCRRAVLRPGRNEIDERLATGENHVRPDG